MKASLIQPQLPRLLVYLYVCTRNRKALERTGALGRQGPRIGADGGIYERFRVVCAESSKGA